MLNERNQKTLFDSVVGACDIEKLFLPRFFSHFILNWVWPNFYSVKKQEEMKRKLFDFRSILENTQFIFTWNCFRQWHAHMWIISTTSPHWTELLSLVPLDIDVSRQKFIFSFKLCAVWIKPFSSFAWTTCIFWPLGARSHPLELFFFIYIISLFFSLLDDDNEDWIKYKASQENGGMDGTKWIAHNFEFSQFPVRFGNVKETERNDSKKKMETKTLSTQLNGINANAIQNKANDSNQRLESSSLR